MCRTRKLSRWSAPIHTLLEVIISITHFLSSHCLMNVLMHHRHDLLHQSVFFYFLFCCCFFSVFFISAVPTGSTTLFPLPSVQCVSEYRRRAAWPLALTVRAFFSSPPLSCRCSLLGMQEADCRVAKSYTDGNWVRFLFGSSAIPCCPPSHFSSGIFFFPPIPLELCQQTPLDRDMLMSSSENSQPLENRQCIDCCTVWA